jgi:hypothetical protein
VHALHDGRAARAGAAVGSLYRMLPQGVPDGVTRERVRLQMRAVCDGAHERISMTDFAHYFGAFTLALAALGVVAAFVERAHDKRQRKR